MKWRSALRARRCIVGGNQDLAEGLERREIGVEEPGPIVVKDRRLGRRAVVLVVVVGLQPSSEELRCAGEGRGERPDVRKMSAGGRHSKYDTPGSFSSEFICGPYWLFRFLKAS